jgi:hypothetical protein
VGYNHIISFGSNCQTAHNSHQGFDKRGSLPFDWWNTPLFSIKLVLSGQFYNLVQASDLQVTPDRETVIHRTCGIFFHHDFPRNPDTNLVLPLTEESIADVAAKYQRRGTRLLEMLASPERKLVVRYDDQGIDNWMKKYLGDLWVDQQPSTLKDVLAPFVAPGSCDILLVTPGAQPRIANLPDGSRIYFDRIDHDEMFNDWRGNMPRWSDVLQLAVSRT